MHPGPDINQQQNSWSKLNIVSTRRPRLDTSGSTISTRQGDPAPVGLNPLARAWKPVLSAHMSKLASAITIPV